jgi:electron transfer flavoprotein beta subunit
MREASVINIIVCVKQVLDPEAPLSAFKIDPATKRALPPAGTPPVLSPYDENALEAAVKVKDAQDAKITVVSAGANLSKAVLKKTLGVGADELVMVEDDSLEYLDSYGTAVILASAIRKIGSYDLIMCGRQASDSDAGQVGAGLAELLGLPCVTLARKVDSVADGKARVERVIDEGYEVVEAQTPAVVTVSSEAGELRLAPLKAIMAAAKKPILTWKPADLGLDAAQYSEAVAKVKIVDLFIPERESKCELVEGDTAEEAGANLALKLRVARII